MPEPMPLSRVSTVDALVAALRSQILSGELGPGSHLSEVDLAGAYGVGRHSLRAAFRELARGGLLVHEPNRGVRVPVPTARESEDLYVHRAALELGALRVALADAAPSAREVPVVPNRTAAASTSTVARRSPDSSIHRL